jgi:hypothetical protein
MPFKMFVVVAALFLSVAADGFAQAPPAQTTTPAQAAPPAQNPTPAQDLQILKADCGKSPCELGSTLTVTFANLKEWAQNKDLTKLVPVFNGRIMTGQHPTCPLPCENTLHFDLRPLDTTDDAAMQNRVAWAALLRSAHTKTSIVMNLGLDGQSDCFGKTTFELTVFSGPITLVVIVFVAALLIAFFVLAAKSDLLRDPGPDPNAPQPGAPNPLPTPGNKRRSFSLARCQMAWWFFIVLGAYLYIWIVTGNRDSLNSGVLTLIGISAATGASSAVIDGSKRDERKKLEAQRDALNAAIGAVPPPANLADLNAQLARVQASIQALPSPPGESEGLLKDILNEEDGVSFHRFQMAGWTIMLGIVFVVTVYQSLVMPDPSATLLGLMGISSGTYIGLKIPNTPK